MNSIRPTITSAPSTICYGTTFTVTFTASKRKNYIALRLMSVPFTTHSYSMGQRSLMLKVSNSNWVGGIKYTLNATSPPNSVIAPPGYYQLWPVQAGVPGNAVWVQLMGWSLCRIRGSITLLSILKFTPTPTIKKAIVKLVSLRVQ